MSLLTNEAFLGIVAAIIGTIFTYLGIVKKSNANVSDIYTVEIRKIIEDLKEDNNKKDEEIAKFEKITGKLETQLQDLKTQLQIALSLVDKIKIEREAIKLEVDKKSFEIEQMSLNKEDK